MGAVDLVKVTFDQQCLQLYYGNGCTATFHWQHFEQILLVNIQDQPHWLMQSGKNYALIKMGVRGEEKLLGFFKSWPYFDRDGLVKWLDKPTLPEFCCFTRL